MGDPYMELSLELIWENLAVFFEQPAYNIIIQISAIIGWVILTVLLISGALQVLLLYKQEEYTKKWQWVLLAVDIPQLNVQTPKAVEQLFSHLAGSLDPPNVAKKFRLGYMQVPFSFEIISIEGYIQFLIRTDATFRDLVEAALYAQYPDADVVEVEDYVGSIPSVYPNDTHGVWAGEFKLAENSAYPIRTYEEFEHSISKDTVLKDPMGTFLESFTRIGEGEQMWFQLVIVPVTNSWKEGAIKIVKKLIGEKKAVSGGSKMVDALSSAPLKLLEGIGDQVFGREPSAGGGKPEGREEPNLMRYLTPGQSKLVERIEDKISKIGFAVKMRGIYAARKEVYKPQHGVQALLGAISQFNIPSANSIVPGLTPDVSYFFKNRLAEWRRTRVVRAFKERSTKKGLPAFILNIEELATIWHFPMSHVKTPFVQKAAMKAAEPPAGLPFEAAADVLIPTDEGEKKTKKRQEFVADTGPEYKDDQRFG